MENENKFQVKWNIIDNEEYSNRLHTVFKAVSNAITCTLGPWGSNTCIEEGKTAIHVTKDGLNVIRCIEFDNTMANNILKIITNICYSMMLKVGDGTSSSIVGAEKLYEVISSDKVLKKLRSRDLENLFEKVKTAICEEIVTLSTKIDEGDSDTIYRIANISTNGDEKLSNMMKEIYEKVKYPVINYRQGLGFETTYEIVTGFKTSAHYLNDCYRTNDRNECHLKDPMVMLFDHKIDYDTHYKRLIEPIKNAILMQAQLTGEFRQLVVCAPYFDEELLHHLTQDYNRCQKSKMPIIDIYVKNYSNTVYDRQVIEDMSAFCGCNVIREEVIKRLQYCTSLDFDIERVGDPTYVSKGDFGIINEKELLDAYCEGKELSEETQEKMVFQLNMYVGSVKKMITTDSYTLIEEFDNPDTARIETLIRDAQANLNKSNDESKSKLVVHSDLSDIKKRLGRLRGQIVNINIGGETEMAKQFEQDVIDDTVKACESAKKYGYNIGGNLIIPIAIKNLVEREGANYSEKEYRLLTLIDTAFRQVFATVLSNKYNNPRYWEPSEDGYVDIEKITQHCIDNNICYDLTKDDYSADIINPSYTDIEIINSTLHILNLLMNTNQYITSLIDITAVSKLVNK